MEFARSRLLTAIATALLLGACGGGGGGGDAGGSTSATPTTPSSSSSSQAGSSNSSSEASSASSSNGASSSSSSSSSNPPITATGSCPAISLSAPDAKTFTGDSTPFQSAEYGVRNYAPPIEIDGKHKPENYMAAPVQPTWQFASSDPTDGTLTNLECDVAPDNGWHSYVRASGTAATITHQKVTVTGGRNAVPGRIYTVFNGQQLVAAINEAKNEPKIIRVVGHIDLRMESNNTVFKEYTSYRDQKFGGSIMIPSNTTLVGINDKDGKPARITGTTILIGSELANGAATAEAGFKAWISAGKDGDQYPTWTRNIIIRNLKIDTPWDVNPEGTADAYADGVTISRAQNIWIDHVSITDGDTPDSLATGTYKTRHDGSLDIVRGSDYVSVTNSFFGDHGKNTLVGNGDSGRAWSDQGRLHVTFSGLWWRGIASRHPLTRFSQLHTYNNLMEGTTGTASYGHKFENGLDVRYQSSVFSENNFHLFAGLKPKEVCGKISGGSQGLGFRVTGAQFISDKTDDGKAWSGGPIDVTTALAAAACPEVPAADITWTPPYNYSALDANAARAAIEVNSGAGRIGIFAKLGTARDLGATSSSSSSSSSSSAGGDSSSSSSSSAGPAPVCTGVFACDSGVGAQVMNASVTASTSESVDAVTGTYTIAGAGKMDNSNSYNFYFKHMPLTGNFVMTARILTQGGTANSGARAGLIAVESLSAAPAFAWTARYNDAAGQIRAAINGNAKSAISGYSNSTLPVWVRIERRGNALYSAASTDGTNWTEVTNTSVSAATIYAGLAVSSGDNASSATATFDNLSVTGGGL